MSKTYKELRTEYNRPSFKQELFNIHGCRCINCGSDLDVELHHIVPLRLGGTNRITNIVPLCYLCHQKAHGSVKIREICRTEKPGRHRAKPVENYKDIIDDYLSGLIGRKECEKMLGLPKGSKLNDKWYFKELLKEKKIKYFKNTIDVLNCSKNAHNDHSHKVVSKIEYEDGSEYKRYGSGRSEIILPCDK